MISIHSKGYKMEELNILDILDEKFSKMDLERYEAIKNLNKKAKDKLHKALLKKWDEDITRLKDIMSRQ